MLRKLFGFKIWLPIMVVCLLGLVFVYPMGQKDEAPAIRKGMPKSDGLGRDRPMAPPFALAPAPPPPPQKSLVKEALTYGGGLSVLVNLINLLGKISIGAKWLWRKIRGM